MPAITLVTLDQVPCELLGPEGTWRQILLSQDTVSSAQSCMGYAHFAPGAITDPIAHDTEELVFVAKGQGEVRGSNQVIEFAEHDFLYIPAGASHSIVNTGKEEIVMVFSFPSPRYPATWRSS